MQGEVSYREPDDQSIFASDLESGIGAPASAATTGTSAAKKAVLFTSVLLFIAASVMLVQLSNDQPSSFNYDSDSPTAPRESSNNRTRAEPRQGQLKAGGVLLRAHSDENSDGAGDNEVAEESKNQSVTTLIASTTDLDASESTDSTELTTSSDERLLQPTDKPQILTSDTTGRDGYAILTQTANQSNIPTASLTNLSIPADSVVTIFDFEADQEMQSTTKLLEIDLITTSFENLTTLTGNSTEHDVPKMLSDSQTTNSPIMVNTFASMLQLLPTENYVLRLLSLEEFQVNSPKFKRPKRSSSTMLNISGSTMSILLEDSVETSTSTEGFFPTTNTSPSLFEESIKTNVPPDRFTTTMLDTTQGTTLLLEVDEEVENISTPKSLSTLSQFVDVDQVTSTDLLQTTRVTSEGPTEASQLSILLNDYTVPVPTKDIKAIQINSMESTKSNPISTLPKSFVDTTTELVASKDLQQASVENHLKTTILPALVSVPLTETEQSTSEESTETRQMSIMKETTVFNLFETSTPPTNIQTSSGKSEENNSILLESTTIQTFPKDTSTSKELTTLLDSSTTSIDIVTLEKLADTTAASHQEPMETTNIVTFGKPLETSQGSTTILSIDNTAAISKKSEIHIQSADAHSGTSIKAVETTLSEDFSDTTSFRDSLPSEEPTVSSQESSTIYIQIMDRTPLTTGESSGSILLEDSLSTIPSTDTSIFGEPLIDNQMIENTTIQVHSTSTDVSKNPIETTLFEGTTAIMSSIDTITSKESIESSQESTTEFSKSTLLEDSTTAMLSTDIVTLEEPTEFTNNQTLESTTLQVYSIDTTIVASKKSLETQLFENTSATMPLRNKEPTESSQEITTVYRQGADTAPLFSSKPTEVWATKIEVYEGFTTVPFTDTVTVEEPNELPENTITQMQSADITFTTPIREVVSSAGIITTEKSIASNEVLESITKQMQYTYTTPATLRHLIKTTLSKDSTLEEAEENRTIESTTSVNTSTVTSTELTEMTLFENSRSITSFTNTLNSEEPKETSQILENTTAPIHFMDTTSTTFKKPIDSTTEILESKTLKMHSMDVAPVTSQETTLFQDSESSVSSTDTSGLEELLRTSQLSESTTIQMQSTDTTRNILKEPVKTTSLEGSTIEILSTSTAMLEESTESIEMSENTTIQIQSVDTTTVIVRESIETTLDGRSTIVTVNELTENVQASTAITSEKSTVTTLFENFTETIALFIDSTASKEDKVETSEILEKNTAIQLTFPNTTTTALREFTKPTSFEGFTTEISSLSTITLDKFNENSQESATTQMQLIEDTTPTTSKKPTDTFLNINTIEAATSVEYTKTTEVVENTKIEMQSIDTITPVILTESALFEGSTEVENSAESTTMQMHFIDTTVLEEHSESSPILESTTKQMTPINLAEITESTFNESSTIEMLYLNSKTSKELVENDEESTTMHQMQSLGTTQVTLREPTGTTFPESSARTILSTTSTKSVDDTSSQISEITTLQMQSTYYTTAVTLEQFPTTTMLPTNTTYSEKPTEINQGSATIQTHSINNTLFNLEGVTETTPFEDSITETLSTSPITSENIQGSTTAMSSIETTTFEDLVETSPIFENTVIQIQPVHTTLVSTKKPMKAKSYKGSTAITLFTDTVTSEEPIRTSTEILETTTVQMQSTGTTPVITKTTTISSTGTGTITLDKPTETNQILVLDHTTPQMQSTDTIPVTFGESTETSQVSTIFSDPTVTTMQFADHPHPTRVSLKEPTNNSRSSISFTTPPIDTSTTEMVTTWRSSEGKSKIPTSSAFTKPLLAETNEMSTELESTTPLSDVNNTLVTATEGVLEIHTTGTQRSTTKAISMMPTTGSARISTSQISSTFKMFATHFKTVTSLSSTDSTSPASLTPSRPLATTLKSQTKLQPMGKNCGSSSSREDCKSSAATSTERTSTKTDKSTATRTTSLFTSRPTFTTQYYNRYTLPLPARPASRQPKRPRNYYEYYLRKGHFPLCAAALAFLHSLFGGFNYY